MKSGKPVETDEEVAKLARTSPDTVRKVERIKEKASSEELNALRNDEDGISINSVYQKYYGKKEKTKPSPAPAKESDSSTAPDQQSPKIQKTMLEQNSPASQGTPKIDPIDFGTASTVAVVESIKPSSPELEEKVDGMCKYFRNTIAYCRLKEDRLYVRHRLNKLVKEIEAIWETITPQE